MKRYSTLLIIREMHVKTTMRHQFTPTTTKRATVKNTVTRVVKGTGELDCSHTTGRNVQGAATLQNRLAIPEVVKHELLCDPAIQLLGIYPRERNIYVRAKTCT